MVVATLLVATSFPVVAAIAQGLDSLVMTLLRFALATILIAPIVAWRTGLGWPGLAGLLRYAALSACLVGFFWGMFAALRTTTALNTSTIFTLTPVITAGFAYLMVRERLGTAARLALPVAALGAVWVIFRGDLAALLALELGRGDVIFFGATLALGLYGPLIKLFHRGEPMARMTFWTLATGTAWLILLAGPRLGNIEWSLVPVEVYAGIAYLALFTTMVTFFLFQWSTTIIGPTRAQSYTYVTPALVLGIDLLLGQPAPPAATYPGLVLIVGATFILLRARDGRT